jgi:NhaP-type Na+/H+ or K+/H+ antiporter
VVQSLIALSLVLAVWSLLARPIMAGRITAPIMLVVAGVAIEYGTYHALADILNAEVAEHFAELILAILLFVDATDVRGGLFGRNPGSALRMLLIALPLSVAAAVGLGLWLLPGMSWAVVLVVACVVIPTDFAPAASILRDERLPARVRNLLNVEAGYKDGMLSPVLVFGLAVAVGLEERGSPMVAVGAAIPEIAIGLVVGLVVGAVLAGLANVAGRRDLMTDQSRRIMLVVAPLLSFSLSEGLGGNGFVAAFVCGIAFHYIRHAEDIEREMELVDDNATLLTATMWFAFGGIGTIALMYGGITARMVVFCVVVLTVLRLIPVLLAMIGSGFSLSEKLLLGWLGPRGTTSIVFGLLAFSALEGTAEKPVLQIMSLVVFGSVALHGLTAPAIARAYARANPQQPEPSPEPSQPPPGHSG